ncbi:ABC transporter ATP-binding protein [Cellulomonas massiliensis]|uniref:ABC transporter ATP-binding protein n=1 Tax=Cellulomonas massiliensis TaxID=1465811 RepID=UPI000474E1F3|nr:ABC transporter ATP-binding protein [Cellulomonas massiliensis]
MTWGVRDLTVRHGERVALDGVTLAVPAGQVVAVVGGDGAGKTTLLRALAGAVAPADGHVDAPPPDRSGFMPTASGVWRELTVDENVDFVAAAYGVRGEALARRRRDLLGAAGLQDVRGRLASALSGGMRQKLAFCLAMLHEPPLLVLDEPSTGVDPVSRVDLWRLVSGAAARGAAVAMATTYLDEAERCAHVLVLDGGRALLSGPPDAVVRDAPGVVVRTAEATDRARAWRRGRELHEWSPRTPARGEPLDPPDLEDAVIAAALAQEALRG